MSEIDTKVMLFFPSHPLLIYRPSTVPNPSLHCLFVLVMVQHSNVGIVFHYLYEQFVLLLLLVIIACGFLAPFLAWRHLACVYWFGD